MQEDNYINGQEVRSALHKSHWATLEKDQLQVDGCDAVQAGHVAMLWPWQSFTRFGRQS